MADDLLSQEEIEALLKGIGGASKQDEDEELKEIASLYAQAFTNVLQLLSGGEVKIDVGESRVCGQAAFVEELEKSSYLLYVVDYDAFEGWYHAFVMSERTALLLADIMMGGDGVELPDSMNDLYLSAAQEGLSQITGAAISEMVNLLSGRRIGIKNTSCSLKVEGWLPFELLPSSENVWVFSLNAEIKDVGNLKLWSLMPQKIVQVLSDEIKKRVGSREQPQKRSEQGPKETGSPVSAKVSQVAREASGRVVGEEVSGAVEVRPAEFVPLDKQIADQDMDGHNFDLIVDVPVRITVRLGQAAKTIGEILNLTPGSVIELDKMAGDPVDILVNGKLIARGEVVVIDENFGVRITEIVNRSDRIKSLR